MACSQQQIYRKYFITSIALSYNLHLPSPIFSIFWKSSIVDAITDKANACITKGKQCYISDFTTIIT
jgi:hypothetical protein